MRLVLPLVAVLAFACGTSRARQIERRHECDWRCYDVAADAGRDPVTEHILEHCLRECCRADRFPDQCE